MLDPGRYFAEAIYFLQYALAQILWAINRATLSIAVIAESINTWVTDNVAYFVELLVNGLSAPLGGMFILALTALGFWYALNNIVPTNRWVDPSKLFTYGLITFFFFSSPIVVINMMEDLRASLNAGLDQALIDGAAGDIFATSMNGTDAGLPGAIPDVNSDGIIASFDLVTAFMLVANLDEMDSSEFPVDFEATYFPFGDPAGIDLSDEADQELAKALASDGIERLFFALVAIPTAIAEHFLRLALTGVAMFLYLGVPFAMLFAFFIYTQAFLAAYLKQFINLLIETFMSVIIATIMIGLLAAAAQEGIGLYIGASLITCIVLLWRIKSAMKLAAAAFDLFGGAVITGGAGGMTLPQMGRQAVTGAVGLAGAALTGGTTLALGGAVLASAAALQADGQAEGAYLGTDPSKTEGRVRQLKTIAGYTLGRSETARHLIESGHEIRTLGRNFRDGAVQAHDPDTLDYLRAGSAMSGFGSSPWLAMRFSPSLRAAYDEIGGRREGHRDASFDGDGEPTEGVNGTLPGRGRIRTTPGQAQQFTGDTGAELWREEPATSRQLAYLRQLGADAPAHLSRGEASDLINQSQRRPRQIGTAHDPGTRPPATPDQALNQHLVSLEQAITSLTQALAQPSGVGAAANPSTPSTTAVNGPIPDWLREPDPAPARETSRPPLGPIRPPDIPRFRPLALPAAGPAANHAAADPFAAAGTSDALPFLVETTPPDGVPDGTGPAPNWLPPRTIRFEPHSAARQQVIGETLARLEEPEAAAGQAAYQTLVTYTGPDNAALIRQAVSQHSAPVVQDAAAATADLVAGYRNEGQSEAAILDNFQKGGAAASLRATSNTPLDDAQLSAVADMVLLPQRSLDRTELVTLIGQQAAAGATSEQAVAQALGTPVTFAGQTGTIRGVMAGIREMDLSPADLARLAALVQDGLREGAQAELAARGYRPELVRDFVSDMAALPGTLVVPQTTAGPVTAAALEPQTREVPDGSTSRQKDEEARNS